MPIHIISFKDIISSDHNNILAAFRRKITMIKIVDYLENYVKATKKGKCRACGKDVQWSSSKLCGHKRSNCSGATDAEKQLFRGNPQFSSRSDLNSLDDSGDTSLTVDLNVPISDEKKATIDSKVTKLFCRTGMSFRIADSEAFRDLVKELNPAYAEQMPKSRTFSGVLLDEEYNKSYKKLTELLNESNELTLISDGWTNTRGDHIVNFLVKTPTHAPIFLKSIDTSGIIQNGENVAKEILEVT